MSSAELVVTKAEDLPLPVIHTIAGCESVEEAAGLIELDYPDLVVSRGDIRSIMKQRRVEVEADEAVLNPSSIDLLLGTIDRGLNAEINRITRRVMVLTKIAAEPPGTECTVDETGEHFTPEDAREELIAHRGTLLELKKSFVDQKKAEAAMKDTGVHLNVDLGNVMSKALDNIKAMELPGEAKVVG